MVRRAAPGDLAVSIVFATLLLTPAALVLAGRGGADTAFLQKTEQRAPFVAPPVSTGALATGGWERDLERQIADSFPLRRPLIETYAAAKHALGDSGSPRVLRGRDGWLFLAEDERAYATGAFRPSDAELARTADVYAARAAWCARHGIRYAFLLVPNKSTIYREQLPPGIAYAAPSPADRLLPLLAARAVRTIDVRDALRAAARRGEVYSRGDTHWNDAGAYLAYGATVRALHDAGARNAIARDALRERIDVTGGDLLRISGLSTLAENRVLRYAFPQRAHDVADVAPPGDFLRTVTAVEDARLPTLVAFGDSFLEQLRPFLAESFRRAVFLRHLRPTDRQFDRELLARERPTVVLQELVERNLVHESAFGP